ncbi:MAG: type II secretion system F family protein [Clostridia bacterium]
MKKAALHAGMAGMFVFALYRNVLISVLAGITIATCVLLDKKAIAQDRKKQGELLFFNYLNCLLPLFNVSRPLIHTLDHAAMDYCVIYGEDLFIQALRQGLNQAKVAHDLGKALEHAAQRFLSEDMAVFSSVLVLCEKSGGDIAESVKSSIEMIRDKINIRLEMEMMLAEKQIEQRIISVMPVVLLLLFSLTSPEYLEPLYSTTGGRVTMTFAGFVMLLQGIIGKKISRIEV